ncbi:MAG TPA: transglutaminase-like cysteine peptidase [Microvirga sp.]|jgi:predicted transglutaminase-like cysteine proteinase|nr:transglutaminase-like cysteine peptidase [Microvirga sp.]
MWGLGAEAGRPAAGRLITLAALAAAAIVGFGIPAASTRPLPAKPVPPGPSGTARPTAAWSAFCLQHPGECAVDRAEPEIVPFTPQVLAALTAVNRSVNRAIVPVPDLEHWGVTDRWDFPDDGRGDCEDIQLLKRRLLAERGLPRRAMRMTVVINGKGEGHAVLTVRTSRGDLILDNARDDVLPPRRTGYAFVKREGSDGRAWVWLDGTSAPVVTTAR